MPTSEEQQTQQRQSKFVWKALQGRPGIGGQPFCETPAGGHRNEPLDSAPVTRLPSGAPKPPDNVHSDLRRPRNLEVLPPVIEDSGDPQTEPPHLGARNPNSPRPDSRVTSAAQARTAGEGSWKPLFDLELGKDRRYAVAQTTDQEPVLLLVQRMSTKNAGATLQTIQNLNHKNLLAAIPEFCGEEDLIAWEFMPMSLLLLAKSRFLNELGIASILGQVLDGLQELHAQGLEHCGLSCSTVLINDTGVVKICGLEYCKNMSDASSAGIDTAGLKRLTLELVEGHYDEGLNAKGHIQITNVNLDNLSNIIDFIDKLNGRVEVSKLKEQLLFSLDWKPEVLRGMIAYAQYFSFWVKKYPSQVVQG